MWLLNTASDTVVSLVIPAVWHRKSEICSNWTFLWNKVICTAEYNRILTLETYSNFPKNAYFLWHRVSAAVAAFKSGKIK